MTAEAPALDIADTPRIIPVAVPRMVHIRSDRLNEKRQDRVDDASRKLNGEDHQKQREDSRVSRYYAEIRKRFDEFDAFLFAGSEILFHQKGDQQRRNQKKERGYDEGRPVSVEVGNDSAEQRSYRRADKTDDWRSPRQNPTLRSGTIDVVSTVAAAMVPVTQPCIIRSTRSCHGAVTNVIRPTITAPPNIARSSIFRRP